MIAPTSAPPRVLILTSPGIFGAEILRRLAAEPGLDIVGIGLTNRIYKGLGTLSGARKFLKRTGWKYTWYNILTGPVAWNWLSLSGGLRPLKSLAPPRLIADINDQPTRDWIASLAPDYIASFYFNQWIGPEVRSLARRDAVNVHPSLLPTFRGPDPVFRMLESGAATAGITIHRTVDDFDAGDILYQASHDIPQNTSALGLYLELVRRGSELLARHLTDSLPPLPLPTSPASSPSHTADYRTFPTPPEVHRFLHTGRHLYHKHELPQAVKQLSRKEINV